MLNAVIVGGIVWMSLLLAVVAWTAARAESQLARILAVDTLALLVITLLVLLAYARRSADYLDAALVLALLSFLGTLAAAEYARERDLP